MTAYIKLATREFPLHQGDIRLEHPEIGADFIGPRLVTRLLTIRLSAMKPIRDGMVEA